MQLKTKRENTNQINPIFKNKNGKIKIGPILITLIALTAIAFSAYLLFITFNFDLQSLKLLNNKPKTFRIIKGDVYWIKDKEDKQLAVSKTSVEKDIAKFVDLIPSPSGKGVVLMAQASYNQHVMFYMDAQTEEVHFVDLAAEVAWPQENDNVFAYTKKPSASGPRELYVYFPTQRKSQQLMKEDKEKCRMSYRGLQWVNKDTAIKANYSIPNCPLDQMQPAELTGEITVAVPETT